MALLLAFLLCVPLLAGLDNRTAAAAPPAPTAITVDGASPGRTFDGIGAISGGGGNSRLLVDYPEPQRARILDYLFKPGQGAALQTLKVEIGGDTNSTDGSESSIEHERGTVNCDNGYEWWLMKQAKQRNPRIGLAALSWGAPGWIGDGNFWSQDMIDYLVRWLGCAERHGLTIDYLGGWNERGYDAGWYKKLRADLDAKGYDKVKIVADDSAGWDVATAMGKDPELNKAIDVVGSHYPCGYLSEMTSCPSSADAVAIGKPLWASENGSKDTETGAAAMARGINRGYLDGRMTSFMHWPLVAALYPNQYFNTVGMVVADQPWSGAYRVGRSTWVTAQTTQFTARGWKYLDTAGGYLGGARENGSYVSYAAPDKSAWSTVLETTQATAEQEVTLKTAGGLPGGTLHVWSTDLNSAHPRMTSAGDLTAVDGTYRLTLKPGHVYTVTTTTGQGAATATGPERSPLRLPYKDSFADYPVGREAKYFASMNGAFESAPCGGGRDGNCLRQMAPQVPIRWTDEPGHQPYALMGDLSWSNYTASARVLLEEEGQAEILGRVSTQNRNNNGLDAYHLRLGQDGAWSLLKTDKDWKFTTLASGKVTAPGTGTWHRLALTFEGSEITVRIDGKKLTTVRDTSYAGGMTGIGTGGWTTAQYADFSVQPGRSAALPEGTYKLVNAHTGKVLDASGGGTADGTPVVQWDDNGGANQRWRLTPAGDGYYTVTGAASGKVLDVPGNTPVPGTPLHLWQGNGGTGQQWQIALSDNGAYTLTSRATGSKLDVDKASTASGAKAVQNIPGGAAVQRWRIERTD
ncbi:RICIN domain-containing protein [Streptomyces sp. NA04227]|uniref:RICIN domain-containing protein n=1 Tax=Streptomyces sp. NA04227 TaxID=2742136 RepID=UPI0020CA4D6A|nr:RICIN domain-containing protein [Streptomyces sp. NA04227]